MKFSIKDFFCKIWPNHGLMISEKSINKNNIKWFTRSCSWISCLVFTKKTCVVTKIYCVLLAFILPDLVWCWWHIIKQIFHSFFCLISKLLTFGNIIFNSASLCWLITTSLPSARSFTLIGQNFPKRGNSKAVWRRLKNLEQNPG